jgi:predicted CoA-binding protein
MDLKEQMKEFERKKVWAVVGSVHNKEKFAYKIYKFMKSRGYTVYPVDPSGMDIDGEPSFKRLTDLPETPEVIDMVINPIKGDGFIEEANRLNIKYVWFQPGAENSELVEKAESYGMNVIYNQCVMVQF